MRTLHALLITFLTLAVNAGELPIIEKLYQDEDVALEAQVNGQIFKVIRKETIRSPSGQSDAFGRSYDRGFREVLYRGVTTEGKPVLRYVDVAIQPGGIKIDQKLGVKNPRAKLPAGIVSYARDTSVATNAGKTATLPANATDIVVDLGKSKEFRFGTIILVINKADKSSIAYTLHQTFSPDR